MADETEYDYLIGSVLAAASVEAGLEALVSDANAAKDAAETAQAAAEAAADAASTSKDNAADSETAAAASASAAATSETNAASSASAASSSAGNASDAQNAAEAARDQAKLNVVKKTGTAYSVVSADDGNMLVFDESSEVTITLPEQATEALAESFELGFYQKGAGKLKFVTEGSDTLENIDFHTRSEGKGAIVHLFLETAGAPNNYVLSGRTSA